MREQLIAESPSTSVGETKSHQFLTFSLSGETFAIETLCVKEIIEYGQLTTVPMMPASIRGVINLRGAVVPVIDLGARFSGQQTKICRRTCIVIIEIENEETHQDIGIVVDAVSAVIELPLCDIEPPPSFGSKIRTDFIEGMGKINDRFVIILNVGRVLSVEELSTLAAVVRT